MILKSEMSIQEWKISSKTYLQVWRKDWFRPDQLLENSNMRSLWDTRILVIKQMDLRQ